MSATYKDCPQDIRIHAARIVADYGMDPGLLQGAIAAALDREREVHSGRPATDLDTLIHLASEAVLKVLEHDGGDFNLDVGPHGGCLIKHEGYFSLSVTMKAAVTAVITEMARHG